jgi:hypothetical protein
MHLFSLKNIIDLPEDFAKSKSFYSKQDLENALKKLSMLRVKLSQSKELFPEIEAELFEASQNLQKVLASEKPRSSEKIHPSSIFYDCSRAVFYGIKNFATNPTVAVSSTLQRTFDYGTWWHNHIQSRFLSYLKNYPNQTIGHFKVVGFKPEVKAVDVRNFISGRADGVIECMDLSQNKKINILLEIKTINSFSFAKLSEPLEHHIVQANIYAEILGCEALFFIYVNKDSSTFKEFFIDKNILTLNKTYSKNISATKEKVATIINSVKENTLPERALDCESVKSKRACKCPYSKTCFKE